MYGAPPAEWHWRMNNQEAAIKKKTYRFHLSLIDIAGLDSIYELEKTVYYDKLDDEQRSLISFADWVALVGKRKNVWSLEPPPPQRFPTDCFFHSAASIKSKNVAIFCILCLRVFFSNTTKHCFSLCVNLGVRAVKVALRDSYNGDASIEFKVSHFVYFFISNPGCPRLFYFLSTLVFVFVVFDCFW